MIVARVSVMSDAMKPDTDMSNRTVNGIGDTLVGSGAVLDMVTTGLVVSVTDTVSMMVLELPAASVTV